jgi:hypothetical protein
MRCESDYATSAISRTKISIIEFKWAQTVDELPNLASEFVRMNVDIIFAPVSTFVAPARLATSTIPIVFASHADPVGLGHVASLARPGDTEAARVDQNSLKDGLKVAWRTGDRAEYLGGRRLLLQRLGKVPPHLGELTSARFELLFQLAQRIGPVANARFSLRSGRRKLAGARCTFARQGHLVGTVTGPPLRPSPLADRPRVLFSLTSAELI